MRQRIRSHLTYANVAATLALFFGLAGGIAYAAVTSSDIKNDTIKTADLNFPVGGDGAVSSRGFGLEGGYKQIASTKVKHDDPGILEAVATVDVHNKNGVAENLQIRISDGTRSRVYQQTLIGSNDLTVTVSLNGHAPAGGQNVSVAVRGPHGVFVTKGSVNAEVMPRI